MPYSSLYEKVLTDLLGGAGTYDVIFIDDPWFPMFAGGGFLTPLADFGYRADPDFVPTTIDVSSWPPPRGPRMPGVSAGERPVVYALPLVGNVQMFFYRKDVADRIGASGPETWDDLVTISQKVTDRSRGFFGFVHRGARGNPIVTNFNPFLWSFGGDIFDDNWNVTVNDAKGVAALQLYVDLLQFAPSGVADYNADEVGTAMLQGNAFSAIVWPAWAVQMDDPSRSRVVGQIEFTVTPRKERHAPQQGKWLMAIPQAARNKQPAFRFIEWASAADTMKEYTRRGGVPTRLSSFTDPELVASQRYLPAVYSSLTQAVWRPRTPEWAGVEDILGTHLQRALTRSASPQAALNAAAQEIRQEMRRAGY